MLNWKIFIALGLIPTSIIIMTLQNQDCTDGWYITGYYTPKESDFNSTKISIEIDGETYEFDEKFVKAVKVEGWGKTVDENYLGWYDSKFHLADFPKDMNGNLLNINMVASDPSVLEKDVKIRIPSLPPPWDSKTLIVTDVGPAIVGKHIDVYTGEGKDAEMETKRITSQNNIVCIINP